MDTLDTKIVFYSTGEVGKGSGNRGKKLPAWPSKCDHWCVIRKYFCMYNCVHGPSACSSCNCKQMCGFENGVGTRWRQESWIQAEAFAAEINFVFWNEHIE